MENAAHDGIEDYFARFFTVLSSANVRQAELAFRYCP